MSFAMLTVLATSFAPPVTRVAAPRGGAAQIRMCVRCWASRDDRRLALLPFNAEDVMLPGEKRELKRRRAWSRGEH